MAHNATTLPVETAVIWSDDEEAPDAVVAARAAAAARRAEARRRAAAAARAATTASGASSSSLQMTAVSTGRAVALVRAMTDYNVSVTRRTTTRSTQCGQQYDC